MRDGVTKQQLIDSLSETLRLLSVGISGLELLNKNFVQINYEDGFSRIADISCDSGIAIIRDVCKHI